MYGLFQFKKKSCAKFRINSKLLALIVNAILVLKYFKDDNSFQREAEDYKYFGYLRTKREIKICNCPAQPDVELYTGRVVPEPNQKFLFKGLLEAMTETFYDSEIQPEPDTIHSDNYPYPK